MKRRIEVIKPEYVYLKLKPNNSIRNNKTHLIAKTVANMYKTIWHTRNKEEEKIFHLFNREFAFTTKWSFKRRGKIAYFIYMEKKKVEFYFIIPTSVYEVMEDRINGVWEGVTKEVVQTIPTFGENSYRYQMVYEHEDGLSLATNRTNNDLLNTSLNVVDLLEEGDRAGILYNFIPTSQNSFKYGYHSTIEKVRNGKPTERKKTGFPFLFKWTLNLIDTLINDITEAFAGKKMVKDESMLESIVDRLNGGKQVSSSTNDKIKGQIVDTQILVMAESPRKHTERPFATAIAQSFDVISDDNRLVEDKHYGKVDFESTKLHKVKVNKMYDDEIQNLIALPGREILERFPFMEKVETQENQLPEELQEGKMCLGETTFRGHKQKAFLSEDEEYKKLMLLLIGPTRAGKTNFISHLCMDALENDECVLMLDFIDHCQASEDVKRNFPDDTLVIKFDDPDKLEGLGYNEAKEFIGEKPFDEYQNCKQQSTNTLALINSINDSNSANDTRLSPRMGRYLDSACLVVYASRGALKDVFDVLSDHVTRHKFIKKIPVQLKPYLEKYKDYLYELDTFDKQGNIDGTKYTLINSILDRLSILNRNTYMELMLQNDFTHNVNLVEEFQKNQLIVVQIPEAMFSTQEEKDVMVTYWATKIWYALQIRSVKHKGNLKKLNVIIDEIYQCPNTEIFLTKKISQAAKFGFKPIISCHYIKQLKHMRDELRSVNCSYMLISGCDKENYKELKEELYPFDAEDLANLPRYHSMNYIKYKGGYARFITKLPGDIKKRKKDHSD